MMWWQWASQMTAWCGGSGQIKWLTDLVVGVSQMTDVAMQYCSDVVVEAKSNDWLMWWQWASQMTNWCGGRGASQMTDWCSDTVMLYV